MLLLTVKLCIRLAFFFKSLLPIDLLESIQVQTDPVGLLPLVYM